MTPAQVSNLTALVRTVVAQYGGQLVAGADPVVDGLGQSVDRRSGEFLINEVNTIPDMTEVSVVPKVMRAAGYSYPELLAELCRLAARGICLPRS
ncbi:MAG: hypothetical protein ACRDRS_06930 [Pseudonocardiaceae bacterium]